MGMIWSITVPRNLKFRKARATLCICRRLPLGKSLSTAVQSDAQKRRLLLEPDMLWHHRWKPCSTSKGKCRMLVEGKGLRAGYFFQGKLPFTLPFKLATGAQWAKDRDGRRPAPGEEVGQSIIICTPSTPLHGPPLSSPLPA